MLGLLLRVFSLFAGPWFPAAVGASPKGGRHRLRDPVQAPSSLQPQLLPVPHLSPWGSSAELQERHQAAGIAGEGLAPDPLHVSAEPKGSQHHAFGCGDSHLRALGEGGRPPRGAQEEPDAPRAHAWERQHPSTSLATAEECQRPQCHPCQEPPAWP